MPLKYEKSKYNQKRYKEIFSIFCLKELWSSEELRLLIKHEKAHDFKAHRIPNHQKKTI